MELLELRKEIDGIDDEILSLLARRFKCTDEVGKVKKEQQLSVLNSKRESEILSKIENYFDPQTSVAVQEMYQILMEESKRRQRML